MAYEPSFTPTYPAWEELPSENTPARGSTFAGYDDVITNIETFLDGSTAVKPVEKTNAMTQAVGVASDGKLYTAPGGGGGGGGGGAAEDITYDNTQSGLTASDVQDAIDEVNYNTHHISASDVSTGFSSLSQVLDNLYYITEPCVLPTNEDVVLDNVGYYDEIEDEMLYLMGFHRQGTVSVSQGSVPTINLTPTYSPVRIVSCGGSWKPVFNGGDPIWLPIGSQTDLWSNYGFSSALVLKESLVSGTNNSFSLYLKGSESGTLKYDVWAIYLRKHL